MASSLALEDSLTEAKSFISPALLGQESLAQPDAASKILAIGIYGNARIEDRRNVVSRACSLLQNIAHAAAETFAHGRSQQNADTTLMSCLFPLLDLILIEGVYPGLSTGVGFPQERRKRSTLCNRNCIEFPNLNSLDDVLSILNTLTFGTASGLHRQLQETILLDVIAANAELAYSPSTSEAKQRRTRELLVQDLQNVSTSRLHQILTVLIKGSAPAWLRDGLSHHLSLLALRPRGVRQTIEFLASYYDIQLPSGVEVPSGVAKRRLIHPEALSQATRVLSSVPSSMTVIEYYTQIAPQLIELLDGEYGAELAFAAAKIITNGILTKRDLGAPGKIGWQLFISPQIDAIKPDKSVTSSADIELSVQSEIIVPEAELERALKRLVTMLQATINVPLTGRLLRPILLPLWGIAAYDASSLGSKTSSGLAEDLCKMFLQRCGSLEHLQTVRENISYNGESGWTYGPGESAGIAIRVENSKQLGVDGMDAIASTITRIDKLADIIAASEINEAVIADFVIKSLRTLLDRTRNLPGPISTALMQSESNPASGLTSIYLVQSLFTRFGHKMASQPEQILRLVEQLLFEAVENHKTHQNGRHANISTFLNLTRSDASITIGSASDTSHDVVVTAVSLIKALLSATGLANDNGVVLSLQSIAKHLQYVLQNFTNLDAHSRSMVSSSIELIDSVSRSGNVSPTVQAEEDSIAKLAKAFAINDPSTQAVMVTELLPVINDTKNPLDIPSLTTVLLNQVCINEDTYIHPYINDALAQIAARRSSGYVVRAVNAAYQDTDEQTQLDGRLRLGETLIRLMEVLTDVPRLSPGALGRLLAPISSTCLMIAGRRSARSLEQKQRARAQKQAKIDQQRAERAWGGEVPDLSALEQSDDDELEPSSPGQRAQNHAAIQKLIRGWEGSDKTEDIRMRTSALSVLATVLERAGQALSADMVANAIDLSLAILSIEIGDEAVILRRAAVLVPMAHLKALDGDLEHNLLEPGFDSHKWLEVQERLKVVIQSDSDDLVQENAAAILESLETFRTKLMLGEQSSNTSYDHDNLGLTQLRGLDVQLQGRKGSKIEVLD